MQRLIEIIRNADVEEIDAYVGNNVLAHFAEENITVFSIICRDEIPNSARRLFLRRLSLIPETDSFFSEGENLLFILGCKYHDALLVDLALRLGSFANTKYLTMFTSRCSEYEFDTLLRILERCPDGTSAMDAACSTFRITDANHAAKLMVHIASKAPVKLNSPLMRECFMQAIYRNRVPIVRAFLDIGFNFVEYFTCRNRLGAVRSLAMLELLLSRGAEQFIRKPNRYGESILNTIILNDPPLDLLRRMLELGAIIDRTTRHNVLPESQNYHEILRMLDAATQ